MPLGMNFVRAVIRASAHLEQYAESISDCKLGAVSQSVIQRLLAPASPRMLICRILALLQTCTVSILREIVSRHLHF